MSNINVYLEYSCDVTASAPCGAQMSLEAVQRTLDLVVNPEI